MLEHLGNGGLKMLRCLIAIFVCIPALAHAAPQCKFSPLPALLPVHDLPKYKNAGPYDPGDYERQLLGKFSVKCGAIRHTVPEGAVFNGASIPRGAWTIIGKTPLEGSVLPAAIIHDDMCERVLRTSKEVHRLFHLGLLSSGVTPTTAKIMYGAVLAFGPEWTSPGGPVKRRTYVAGVMELLAMLWRNGRDIVPAREYGDTDFYTAMHEGNLEQKDFREVMTTPPRGDASDQSEVEDMVNKYGGLSEKAARSLLKKIQINN